eukprot:Phypoly_transcript_17734.p1 GENE.Phypoly_transcript_17734~~Phypoly_transcript_17734.p1  ORF type:complete len:203 (+),score=16.63 Phypoly_transcript_17734:70-678(+)
MNNDSTTRPSSFRMNHRQQLQDIYIFEQKLREGAEEVERVRKKYQALMFSMVVLNGVAVWHALKWKISSEGTFWNCTFSYICAYLPVVFGGGSMCWVIFYYYLHVEDSATYVARCNSVLRAYRTYYCPSTGKLVVLRHQGPLPFSIPHNTTHTTPQHSTPHSAHTPPGSDNAPTSMPHPSVLSPLPRPALIQRHETLRKTEC